jgi:hypothetical protein
MVRAMSTPYKATPADWAWLEGNSTVDRCDAAWSRGLVELRARIEALEADGPAVPSREPASVATQPTPASPLVEQGSAPASADVRPTVKARITRDRDETGDYLIIHDASPPASSLVERVTSAIDNAPYDEGRHQWDEARAAIREVAAWLRDRGGYPWAWVAQTLEQEADR